MKTDHGGAMATDATRCTKNLSEGHRHADCSHKSPCSTH